MRGRDGWAGCVTVERGVDDDVLARAGVLDSVRRGDVRLGVAT